METIFNNLINGNLEDAKRGARRYSVARLNGFAQLELGWSAEVSGAAVRYLKGNGSFQSYCDAK